MALGVMPGAPRPTISSETKPDGAQPDPRTPQLGAGGVVRRRFTEELTRSPVLVLPTLDDVFAFERELCREEGAILGGTVQTSTVSSRAWRPRPASSARRGSASNSASGCSGSPPPEPSRGSSPARPRAPVSPRRRRIWWPSCRLRCSTPPRSRPQPPARGLRLSGRAGGDLPRLYRPARLRRPLRPAPDRRRGDRRGQGRPRLLEGPPGLPLRLRRPDPRAARADRRTLGRRPGHRRTHLRRAPGAGGARHPARAAEGAGTRGRADDKGLTRPTPRAHCCSRSNAASAITTRRR